MSQVPEGKVKLSLLRRRVLRRLASLQGPGGGGRGARNYTVSLRKLRSRGVLTPAFSQGVFSFLEATKGRHAGARPGEARMQIAEGTALLSLLSATQKSYRWRAGRPHP